jgi:hypothetical protein
MLPPTSRPKDWEMMEKAPPAPILMLVVMEERDRAVNAIMRKEMSMMSQAPRRPAFPTTHPSRRYMMTPRMVRSVGVKTPAKVP